jgi:ABC-type spermidine/putrescine transport system permease subunit I
MTAGERPTTGVVFVAPLLVVMVVAFNVPLLYMLGLGFWSKSGLTLSHYRDLASTPVYLQVLGNTFRVSVVATVANVLLGYPLAYWMRRLSPRWRIVAIALVVLPFWVSILVRTYAWIVVLGNAGILNRTLQWLGLTSGPVAFLYNELGVTIGMANVLLPFLVLPLYAAMIRIDDRLLLAGASLGASPRVIFWRIFFPLTLPALSAGTLLVFILCLGFYITPAILGGGKVPMIASLLEILINQLPRWETASAVSTILLAATLAFFAIYRWLDRRGAM